MPKDRGFPSLPVLLCLAVASLPAPASGAPALHYQALPLPGAPAAVVAADLDGDGRQDLVVVVAVTRWDQISVEESTKMDDVAGLVESLTVVPALLERRELRVYRGQPGGYASQPLILPLDTSVLSIEAGPAGTPVVALTDSGLSALRLASGGLAWEPLFEQRSVLSGTGTFVSNLGLVHDLDGDGRGDILFPTPDGAAVYLNGPEGLPRNPASRLRYPLAALQPEGASGLARLYPLPEVRDLTGDRLPEILLRDPQRGWRMLWVLRNLGGGRFGEAFSPLPPPPAGKAAAPSRTGQQQPPPAVVWLGDVDGDGRAEVVTQQKHPVPDDAGLRQGLKAAKEPQVTIRLHRARPDLTMDPSPLRQAEVTGYAFDQGGDDDDDEGFRLPGGLQDLNGDGRLDLITITLDFSLFQALKVMTVQRLSLDLDFHVWCQKADGSFQPVRGLDLSGKLTLNLRDLRPGQLSQFAGDFDGDGRPDFLQLGRGRTATVHRGRPDCSFPARADLEIPLQEEPRDLGLVQVRDLDGDRKADLLIIQPQEQRSGESGVTPPVRLDLYLSGGGR